MVIQSTNFFYLLLFLSAFSLNGLESNPAHYSVFSELQTQVGGQLASIFHKKPYIPCGPPRATRLWAEPFSNWLREGDVGDQTGFVARTQGIAGGFDRELGGGDWLVGFGGSYETAELTLHLGQGSGGSHGYYGAFYTDYGADSFYFGISFLAGASKNNLSQPILESSVNTRGSYESFDLIGQIATAYLFGSPAGFVYPYANADLIYSKADAFEETGNSSFNSEISSHLTTTLRTEAGFAVQFQNTNYDETMCVTPSFGLGWVMELPLHRPYYKSHFVSDSIYYKTAGWDHTWQLFSFAFGLNLTYKCVTLAGQYWGEIDPEGRDQFFGQRGNIRLEFSW